MTEPKNQSPSAPSPAGETASEEVTEEMDTIGIPEERQCVCFGTAGCEVCGGSGDLADAKPVGFAAEPAAPIAPAAVSTKVGSVAGWTLYRAVRDFLDSARAGTPFGLEVMDAAVSEWEAENPPNAKPSAEGDGQYDAFLTGEVLHHENRLKVTNGLVGLYWHDDAGHAHKLGDYITPEQESAFRERMANGWKPRKLAEGDGWIAEAEKTCAQLADGVVNYRAKLRAVSDALDENKSYSGHTLFARIRAIVEGK